MTIPLYAALATAAGTIIGCLFGFMRGRAEERKAWIGFVRGTYRSAHGCEQFKIEMVAHAHRVEVEGWSQ